MRNTLVPATAVITRVKIELDRKLGLYLLRSQELGRMAVAVSRDVLKKIAARNNWTTVRTWA